MKKIFIIFLGLVFLPAFCFASISYTRIPADLTIQNPVSFNVSFDDFNIDTGCNSEYGHNYWGVQVYRYWFEIPEWFVSEFVASSSLSNVFNLSLPLGDFIKVSFACSVDGISQNIDGTQFEYNGGTPIFNVIAPAEHYILPGFEMSGALAYAGQLFTDTMPFIALAIGLPVAFWIIKKAIGLIKLK